MPSPVYQRRRKASAHQKAKKHIPDFGLEGFEDNYPFQLSGGNEAESSIATNLSTLPRMPTALPDEPFGNLDAITAGRCRDWLFRLICDKLDASGLSTARRYR
ncbi:MAG: hypothetical protein U5N58_06020 [Actinomycetota bacterium]|nr:hypothetical protein [Actinomycetota bacterium]